MPPSPPCTTPCRVCVAQQLPPSSWRGGTHHRRDRREPRGDSSGLGGHGGLAASASTDLPPATRQPLMVGSGRGRRQTNRPPSAAAAIAINGQWREWGRGGRVIVAVLPRQSPYSQWRPPTSPAPHAPPPAAAQASRRTTDSGGCLGVTWCSGVTVAGRRRRGWATMATQQEWGQLGRVRPGTGSVPNE